MPYFYQHSEGSIIEKPAIVVDRGGGPWDYFNSPFVRDWWFESDLLRPCRTAAPPEPVIVTCHSCEPRHKVFIHDPYRLTLREQLQASLKIAND